METNHGQKVDQNKSDPYWCHRKIQYNKVLIQVLNYMHITTVVVVVHRNAEALTHCSCCHRQGKTISNLKTCNIGSKTAFSLFISVQVSTLDKVYGVNSPRYAFIWKLSPLRGMFWDPSPRQTNEARSTVDSPTNDTRQETKQSDTLARCSVCCDSNDKRHFQHTAQLIMTLPCLPGVLPRLGAALSILQTLHLC